MEYKDYIEHWVENKQTEHKYISKLEHADHLLKELAILDNMKSMSISNQDKGMFDTISNDQFNCMAQYFKLVDDASETGLNNFLEESLEHSPTTPAGAGGAATVGAAAGEEGGDDELDSSTWSCSLTPDCPVLQDLINQENRNMTWLTRAELGFTDTPHEESKSLNFVSNKRPRTSPPRCQVDGVKGNGNIPGDDFMAPADVVMTPQNTKNHHGVSIKSCENRPREVPQFGNKSRLPDRLKNRIYPGKSTNGRLDAMRSDEQTSGQEQQLKCQGPFQSATEKYATDCIKQGKTIDPSIKKSLGGRNSHSKGYKPPTATGSKESEEEEEEMDDRMKGIDKKLAKLIMNEIMDKGLTISWNDISGLDFAKKTIKEIVVWPMLRPDIFTGLRGPPKGVLLFGPPGTGKTLIGKCIASQSKSTFFSISASSLTSKWIGEGEKLVRALFAVARCHQPAVIFIDEIDSLLSQRSESEHESSRRIKTEFLIQLDGVACESEERLLIVGATNRPHEIDEAARRRLVKRLYIPLPDTAARVDILAKLLVQVNHCLSGDDVKRVAELTHGYSGADISSLCRDAALAPIRSIADIENINTNEVRPINVEDMVESTKRVRSSVNEAELELYVNWNKQFGSGL